METINPFIRPPWWEPTISTHISEYIKVKALEKHVTKLRELAEKTSTLIFYTDGSGQRAKIGAAAYTATMEGTGRLHLGSNREYNVFGAQHSTWPPSQHTPLSDSRNASSSRTVKQPSKR